MDMKAGDGSHAAFNDDEKVYQIRQLALAKNDSQAALEAIELCLMLLTNVSVSEEGQKHVLGEGQRTRGIIMENLFGMFCYFLKSGVFDFISNILANATALKEGRDIVMEYDMLPKIVDMLRWNKVSIHRRKHLIEAVRNIAFGYENLEAKFVELNLVRELGYILSFEEGITGDLPEAVAGFKAVKKPLEVSKVNVKNIIDTFILLSNSEPLMKAIADLQIDLLIEQVDVSNHEELDTNVTVLKTQIEQSRLPKVEEPAEEEEEANQEAAAEEQT